jgi:hypothetical protein
VNTYNERSCVRIRGRLKDKTTNEPIEPTTLHWVLYNDSAARQVQGATAITWELEYDEFDNLIGVIGDVLVPGPLNVIADDSLAKETFRLMMVANMDTDTEFSEHYLYYVRNWPGRS